MWSSGFIFMKTSFFAICFWKILLIEYPGKNNLMTEGCFCFAWFLRFLFYFAFYLDVLCASLVGSVPDGRGFQVPWNGSYRWLWASVLVLGIKRQSSGRVASSLNSLATFQGPAWVFWTHSSRAVRPEQWLHVHSCSDGFSTFDSPAAHPGNGPVYNYDRFPLFVSTVKTMPHKLSQRPISQVALDPVKLRINTNQLAEHWTLRRKPISSVCWLSSVMSGEMPAVYVIAACREIMRKVAFLFPVAYRIWLSSWLLGSFTMTQRELFLVFLLFPFHEVSWV